MEFVLNSRDPGPRRVWNPGSGQHFSTSFPADPLDPVGPPEKSGRLDFDGRYHKSATFEGKVPSRNDSWQCISNAKTNNV